MAGLRDALTGFSAAFAGEMDSLIPQSPGYMYDPIRYISTLPSKKIRPFLAYVFYYGYTNRNFDVWQAAEWKVPVALEMLHNFSLIHDDIMDEDDYRRGQPTVHKKWDNSTAILSGDGLLALAYQELLSADHPRLNDLAREFARGVTTVCEGQALDKTFEHDDQVSEPAYLDMINKKTACLIEVASCMGTIAANAPADAVANARMFGNSLGMAFQLQDDFLDLFGDLDKLGKDIGSDLVKNKKSIIMIQVLNHAAVRERVFSLLKMEPIPFGDIKDTLTAAGITDHIRTEIRDYTDAAKQAIKTLTINEETESLLWELTEYLEQRSH
jgi:geranylgeranyl diphosphate synthase type II